MNVKLTRENLSSEAQAEIDALPLLELLRIIRFSPPGTESGPYWAHAFFRLAELRAADPAAYKAASKRLGCEK